MNPKVDASGFAVRISFYVANLVKCGSWCYWEYDLHNNTHKPGWSIAFLLLLIMSCFLEMFCTYLTFHQVFAYTHILLTSLQNPSPYLCEPEWLFRVLWLLEYYYDGWGRCLHDYCWSLASRDWFLLYSCTVLFPQPFFSVPGLMHKNVKL